MKFKSTTLGGVLAFSVSLTLLVVSTTSVRAEPKSMRGRASFYGHKFHGRKTASGAVYDENKLTCAHRTLPFGTKLFVINPETEKSCMVEVNDRGPFHGKRVLDLSRAAARKLGISGIGNVVFYSAKTLAHGVREGITLGGRLSDKPAESTKSIADNRPLPHDQTNKNQLREHARYGFVSEEGGDDTHVHRKLRSRLISAFHD